MWYGAELSTEAGPWLFNHYVDPCGVVSILAWSLGTGKERVTGEKITAVGRKKCGARRKKERGRETEAVAVSLQCRRCATDGQTASSSRAMADPDATPWEIQSSATHTTAGGVLSRRPLQ
jgi:hypothetical protein